MTCQPRSVIRRPIWRPIRVSTSKPAMNAASTSAPERCFHSPSASTTGATGDEPWTIDGRCVSSKSSECDWAPFAIAAKSALVFWRRAMTVACGSPPVASITLPIATASGSTEPRIAVPNQSVTERCAPATTSAGSEASSRSSTNSTSASITGVFIASASYEI